MCVIKDQSELGREGKGLDHKEALMPESKETQRSGEKAQVKGQVARPQEKRQERKAKTEPGRSYGSPTKSLRFCPESYRKTSLGFKQRNNVLRFGFRHCIQWSWGHQAEGMGPVGKPWGDLDRGNREEGADVRGVQRKHSRGLRFPTSYSSISQAGISAPGSQG